MALEKLSEYHREYKRLYKDYVDSQVRWAKWNFWASQQDKYVDWLYENGLKLQDVQAKRPNSDSWDWDDGAGAYHHRHLLYHELDQIRLKRSDELRKAWFDITGDEFTYSEQEIADAIGETVNYTHQIIRRHLTWYVPRREYMARKQHPCNG